MRPSHADAEPEPEPQDDSESARDRAANEAKAQASGQQLRGGVWLSAAKLYFIVIGLVQQVGLTWILGEAYGALRGALSPASVTYGPLLTAGVQGLSRVVTQSRARATNREAETAALLCQGLLGLGVALGFGLGAPLLGSVLHSPHLVTPFKTLAWVILGYSLYAPLVGILNGNHRFLAQAGLDVLAATLRTAALLLFAWWYQRRAPETAVDGACLGFALVAGVMLLVALPLARPHLGSVNWRLMREYAGYVLPIVGSQAVLNLLLQSDTNVLRAFAARAASAAGLEVQRVDALVGAYASAQLFAYLPYQVLVGLTFILFPLLSGASARGDRAAVAQLVRTGLRIAALATGLVVAVTAGLPGPLLRLVFPPQFAELGASAMFGLCLGLGFFALFGVMSGVLTSLGRPWHVLFVTAGAWALGATANAWALRGEPFGPELLVYTAWSTGIAVISASAVSAFLVYRETGALLAPQSGLRIGLGLGCSLLLAHWLAPSSRGSTLLAAGLTAAMYLSVLLLTRELSLKELSSLLGAMRGAGGRRQA